MKVATKIFLYTVLIMTIAFNVGVTVNIYFNYQNSLSIFEEQALNEYYTEMYYLQNEFITAYSKGDTLNEELVFDTISQISNGLGSATGNKAVISQTTGDVIYSDFSGEVSIGDIKADTITTVNYENSLLVLSIFRVGDEDIVFARGFDITHLDVERDRQIIASTAGNVIIITLTAVALYFLAKHLTKPISQLIKATNEIATGNYQKRITVSGNDEIAILSQNYNLMSACIEENVQKLEDYAKTRDDFVRNFSHELKTPLTSIIGYADVLRSKKCDEERTIELSNYIFAEGKRLESLSKQMIYLMKIKQSNFELEPCDIAEIVDKAMFSVRPLAIQKGITIKHSIGCSAKVLCNKELLSAMLINLCNNAIDASDTNGEITLSVKQSQGKLAISIEDNGIGMSKDEIEKITDEFYMIDTSRAGTGTGIGLSICAEIAKLHETELHFESEPNKGTTVTIMLTGGEG